MMWSPKPSGTKRNPNQTKKSESRLPGKWLRVGNDARGVFGTLEAFMLGSRDFACASSKIPTGPGFAASQERCDEPNRCSQEDGSKTAGRRPPCGRVRRSAESGQPGTGVGRCKTPPCTSRWQPESEVVMTSTLQPQARTDRTHEVMDLWRRFYTVHEIAKLLNMTPEAVQATKNRYRGVYESEARHGAS